ncbi:MAG: serine hydrolase domain-containing protein [Micropepsaceae bacterium]
MKIKLVSWFARIVAATLVLSTTALARAEALPTVPVPQAAPVASAPLKHELTASDIEAFLDGLVPLQIESNDIAGATIAIVKDGQLLFAKGYGFADVETRTRVSPETTLFRTGSVTKLFTWTSVMQLVEQGKVDLDADVNTYLDFKIPHTFGKPVTLRNLMTHRGGFQETLKNLGAQDTGKVNLAKYVRENIPDQIFEPGTTPSYSNYGASLAGYVVERVSGVPFDQYVEDNIFKPLGMTHASLRAPLPKELVVDMSKGYALASGGAKDFEIVNGYPAGSESASAIDMSKFMIAHLNGGALGEQRILKPETAALMHNTVTAYDARQNGIALGFYEESRNGMRIIGHGGDTVYFHSDLHLIPSQNLGFFVSYNSAGRSDSPPRSPLWAKFLDRYFPYMAPKVDAIAKGLTATDVAGTYISSRRADTSLLKLLTELSQPTVTANADGSIIVDAFSDLAGQPRKWIALGDGVFRDKFGQAQLVFVMGQDGVMKMLPGSAGVQILERVPQQRNALLVLVVFGLSASILLINFVGFPVAGFVRRHYGVSQDWTFAQNTARLLTMISTLLLFVFVGGMGFVLVSTVSSSPWSLTSAIDPALHRFQMVGFGALAGLFVVIANTLIAWRNPARGLLGKIKEVLVLASYAGIVWFAWSMNLFDVTLRF